MNSVPAVEFKSVSRIYNVHRANDQLSFSMAAGCIHGLIGENGAGKSTAMKMLFGLEKPDEGEILVFGKKVNFSSATAAMNSGIAMVHQHFMLSENETALENFLLMRKNVKTFGWRNHKEELLQAQELSKNYDFEIPWLKPVCELSVGEQQRLEILKALSRHGKILILDEPTAVLTPQEIQDLFKKLRELKKQGHTIILITHKLKEVLEITDSITVMRQGKVTTSLNTSEASVDFLAEKMIGHKMRAAGNFAEAGVASATTPFGEKKLQLKELRAETLDFKLDISSLEVHAGEILGIAGVEGNGQKELIQLLMHPKKFKKIEGHLEILGHDTRFYSTRALRQLSLGFFPEDRLRWGSVPSLNLLQNFILGYQRKLLAAKKFLPWNELFKICAEQIKKFNVRPESPLALFSSLSGGNQQKLVVARELYLNPNLILASHPSRGVDIGATEFIHQQLLDAKKGNAAILLISSELDELIKLSDRIVVLYRGRIQAEFSRSHFNENKIGAAMGGIS